MATLQQTSCQRIHLHDIENRIEAAMRADVILEKSDLDGYAIWMRLRRTVEKLQGAVLWNSVRTSFLNELGMSELGQNRKSSVGLRMSGVG